MKKQFVTYEIALKLKKLGFDEECIMWSNGIINTWAIEIGLIKNSETWLKNKDCTLPLWQQVIDWFRENYNIYIWEQPINSFIDDEEELNSCIFIYQRGITDSPNECDDKEQAILKAIELC